MAQPCNIMLLTSAQIAGRGQAGKKLKWRKISHTQYQLAEVELGVLKVFDVDLDGITVDDGE